MKKTVCAALLLQLGGCSRIDSLLYQPETTPQQWCEAMPCVELFSTGLILNQPSSTLMVYLLGFMWLWVGWRFWKNENGQQSRRWWAIAMTLGGIAALSAGTSYQAFGYELKCAGRELCTWTSWWEIAYLVIQAASMNAMLVAVAYSCTTGNIRRWLRAYACVNMAVHLCITALGIYQANRFLLSFELLILFSTPSFLIYLLVNGSGYFKHRYAKDKVLLGAWLLMTLTNVLYYAYLQLGLTFVLWDKGIWFSENDVLHVLMMAWVIYVGTAVLKVSEDAHS